MSVMTMGDATGAMALRGAMPNDSTQLVNGSESVLDETVAEKKPTRVMATWMVARKSVESAASSSAAVAPFVALLGVVLEARALRGGEGHLRHGEIPVHYGEKERGYDRYGNAHMAKSNLPG